MGVRAFKAGSWLHRWSSRNPSPASGPTRSSRQSFLPARRPRAEKCRLLRHRCPRSRNHPNRRKQLRLRLPRNRRGSTPFLHLRRAGRRIRGSRPGGTSHLLSSPNCRFLPWNQRRAPDRQSILRDSLIPSEHRNPFRARSRHASVRTGKGRSNGTWSQAVTWRFDEMTPVLNPARFRPPWKRACSILTQRSITTFIPAASASRATSSCQDPS